MKRKKRRITGMETPAIKKVKKKLCKAQTFSSDKCSM